MKGFDGAYGGHSRGYPAKRVLSGSSDDDAVLLPFNRPVSPVSAFLSQKELKYYDTFVDFTSPGTSASFADSNITASAGASKVIFNPGQGDSPTSRDGNRILVKSLHIKGSVRLGAIDDGTLIPQPRRIFIAIVRDCITNGASSTGFDVWVNPSGAQHQLMNVHRNLLFGPRYAILRQCQIDMTPTDFEVLTITVPDQTATTGRLECFDFFIPLDDLVVFKANAGVIADVDNISYWVHAFEYPFGAGAGIICPLMEINYSSRVRFISTNN